jgi:hypothetical protein
MLTFQDQYEICQEESGDYSASRLTKFKRDINQGGKVFLNRFSRKYNHGNSTLNLVANQQYYQYSADMLRITEIRVLNGTTYATPDMVTSELEWNQLNSSTSTSTVPTHYFIRGNNEVGLYPTPSANVTNGLQASFEPQHTDMSQADYTTGTITVSNGSVAITHSATGFTPQMVGRWLNVTDGTDGRWYRIASYTSSSQLNLENFYEGISGAGRTFRIGEVMKIPDGYQDAPPAFALRRFYMSQSSPKEASYQMGYFESQLKDAQSTYARSTSRIGADVHTVRPRHNTPFTDLNATITYP